MRALVGFVLVAGVALVLVYRLGGFEGFDANQQGRDARAKIKPGMSWKKVFDITGEPRKYQVIYLKTRTEGAREYQYYEPGPPNKFNPDTVAARVADGSMPHGFLASLVYSSSEAFTIKFDGTGNVVSVTDAPTMADLLQMKD